jgi:PAS domain S-box-containing protein
MSFRSILDQSNLKMRYKGVILVSVPLFLGLVLMVVLFLLLKQTEREVEREAHSRTVLSSANLLGGMFVDCIYTLTGYCFTKSEMLGSRYDRIAAEIPEKLKELANLVSGNADQSKLVGKMQMLATRTMKLLDTLRHCEQDEASDPHEVILLLGTRAHLASLMKEFLANQHKLEDSMQADQSLRATFFTMSDKLQQILFIGVILNMAASLLLAAYFSRAITGRLKTVLDNTIRFTRQEKLLPTLRGTDEIASLDKVFHSMATTIEEAVETIKQSEARVRLVLESMPVGLIIIDPSGVIENVNERTEQMLGYPSSELVGKHLVTLFPEESKNGQETFIKVLTDRALGRSLEFSGRRSDGQSLPIDLSISHLQMREGPRLLTTVVDVRERHEIERLKQEFVAMISHDLKTPLTSIVGNLALVAADAFGPLTERGKHLVGTSEKQAVRLIDMINDLLLLEKMEAGGFELHLARADLTDILDQAIEAVASTARERSVIIETQRTDVHVNVDGMRILQVLINLLSNSIKFSPQNEVVKIVIDETDKWLEVKVTDQGRGIPRDQQQAVFEKFKQVEISDSREKGGTGLGLPICKLIVEKHGGTIGVESEAGKGSTFWFRLPMELVIPA